MEGDTIKLHESLRFSEDDKYNSLNCSNESMPSRKYDVLAERESILPSSRGRADINGSLAAAEFGLRAMLRKSIGVGRGHSSGTNPILWDHGLRMGGAVQDTVVNGRDDKLLN
jgi:hypothetical protein